MGVGNEKARSRWFREGYEAHKREQDENREPLTLASLKSMSADEINERWDEVSAVLGDNAS